MKQCFEFDVLSAHDTFLDVFTTFDYFIFFSYFLLENMKKHLKNSVFNLSLKLIDTRVLVDSQRGYPNLVFFWFMALFLQKNIPRGNNFCCFYFYFESKQEHLCSKAWLPQECSWHHIHQKKVETGQKRLVKINNNHIPVHSKNWKCSNTKLTK